MNSAYFNLQSLYRMNHHLFDKFYLPSEVDKDMLVSNLMADYLENEIVYNDPILLADMIKWWSMERVSTWQTIVDTLAIEYKANENAWRIQTTTTHANSSNEASSNGSSTGVSSDEITKNGFNSGTMLPSERNKTNSDGTSKSSSSSESSSDAQTTEELHGSIGTITNQQMLDSEIKLRLTHNIYKYIKDEFARKFVLMVY